VPWLPPVPLLSPVLPPVPPLLVEEGGGLGSLGLVDGLAGVDGGAVRVVVWLTVVRTGGLGVGLLTCVLLPPPEGARSWGSTGRWWTG